MNAMTQPDADAAILARRLQIAAWIALVDVQLAPIDASNEGQRARTLLRKLEASGLGELTSPPGTDGHAVGLTLAGVKGRAISDGAAATLRLWRDAAYDTLAIL
jgi:hypothetical protein